MTRYHAFNLHNKSHLKKDPNTSAKASDGPCDKDKEGKPQDGKDRILRHGDERLVDTRKLCCENSVTLLLKTNADHSRSFGVCSVYIQYILH